MPLKSYTLQQYRELANPIEDEGGWVLEDNPHKNYHDDRSPTKVQFACMHITVGNHFDTLPDASAEQTAIWGSTTDRKASWHAVVDSDSIVPCLQDKRVAWAQGVSGYTFNRPGLGLEIGTKDTDWRVKSTTWVDRTLRNAACWLAPRVIRYKLPLTNERDRNKIQTMLSAGSVAPFTSHGDLDIANRTDPGIVGSARIDTFPWGKLFQFIQEEVQIRSSLHEVIKLWSRGPHVAAWQTLLDEQQYAVGTIDGVYGPISQAATLAFQKDEGLAQTGIVGREDQLAMEALMSKTSEQLTAIQAQLDAVPGLLDAQYTELRTQILDTRSQLRSEIHAVDAKLDDTNRYSDLLAERIANLQATTETLKTQTFPAVLRRMMEE
jgi:hypothetical protein